MARALSKAASKKVASPKRAPKKNQERPAASPKRKSRGVKQEVASPKASKPIVSALTKAKAKAKEEKEVNQLHGLQMKLVNQLRYRANCPSASAEERERYAKTLEDYFEMKGELKDNFVKEFALNKCKVKDLKWTHKFMVQKEAGKSSASNFVEDFYTRPSCAYLAVSMLVNIVMYSTFHSLH